MEISNIEKNIEIKQWWNKHRLKYNKGLIVAGIVAFILYAIIGINLIMPNDPEFEIILFTTIFQGIGYLFLILIANLFYNLGYLFDRNFNKRNSFIYRRRLFNLGYWFSVSIPFLIPIILLISYFLEFE